MARYRTRSGYTIDWPGDPALAERRGWTVHTDIDAGQVTPAVADDVADDEPDPGDQPEQPDE